MNKLLVPLLLVVHYATLVHERVLMTFDDYHFMAAVLCFTLSSVVYCMTLFQQNRARGLIVFWHLVALYNILSYINIFTSGSIFMIAAGLVAALVARIVLNICLGQSLPLPQDRLQRVALSLWIAAVGLAAFFAFSWTEWGTMDSLRFAVPGLLAFLLTPTLRAVHKWLTPVQLAVLIALGVCHGLPDLADFGIMEAITLAALSVTAAAFCTLGWAYVRFFVEPRRAGRNA